MPSTAKARNVAATLVTRMSAVIGASVLGPRGKLAIAKIPRAHAMHDRTYQRFRVRVLSPIGDQKNFHTFGKMAAATSCAPCSTVSPTLVARKASATVAKPPDAPNGMIRIV